MTALGKLFRTTAFKLTLVYLTIFVLFAAIVLVYFAWNTRRLINEQSSQCEDDEFRWVVPNINDEALRVLGPTDISGNIGHLDGGKLQVGHVIREHLEGLSRTVVSIANREIQFG